MVSIASTLKDKIEVLIDILISKFGKFMRD